MVESSIRRREVALALPELDALLKLLRSAASRRGWNTAALAREAGLDRRELRSMLAGRTPLTVEALLRVAAALELSPGALSAVAPAPPEPEPREGPAPQGRPQLRLVEGGEGSEGPAAGPEGAPDAEEDPWRIDPYGPQAAQVFRMAFGLGIDFLFVARSDQLADSGVPRAVLQRFPEQLPIRLDAAFHRHNQPRFLEDGIELVLSFDGLYTCRFPWSSILHVTLFPEPPEEPASASPPPRKGPALKLVKS